jgi:hypothetical protein
LVTAGLLLTGRAASAGVAGADPEPTPSPAPKTTIDHDGTSGQTAQAA